MADERKQEEMVKQAQDAQDPPKELVEAESEPGTFGGIIPSATSAESAAKQGEGGEHPRVPPTYIDTGGSGGTGKKEPTPVGFFGAIGVWRLGDKIDKGVTKMSWLVDNLFPTKGIAIIAGDSTSGKTWVTLHLLQCLARGQPFFGRVTQQSNMLYIDLENGETEIHRRLTAFMPALSPQDKNAVRNHAFIVDKLGFSLTEGNEMELRRLIRQHDLKVVVFDPLSDLLEGIENKTEDVSPFIKRLRKIADDYGILIILLHHTRKKQQGEADLEGISIRGSTALRASADVTILMKRTMEVGDVSVHFLVKPDKIRCGARPAPINLCLKFLPDASAIMVEDTEAVVAPPSSVFTAKEEILKAIKEKGLEKDFTTNTILVEVKERGHAERTIQAALTELCAEKKLLKPKKGHYRLVGEQQTLDK